MLQPTLSRFLDKKMYKIEVIVVSWAQVICLIHRLKREGCRLEGMGVHIR